MSNNKDDIFAPPSKQELDSIFSAPSKEELAALQPKEEPGTLHDLGLGAAQGASLGFADELEGGVKAGAAKLTGEKGDLLDLYRKYQQLAQKDYDEAKFRSPYAYGAGEIGGGVAGFALAPGSGLAKLGAVGAEKALAGAAGESLLGKLASKGAGQAVEALPGSLAFGAGTSKGKLLGANSEEQKQLIKDTLESGATGSLVGAGLGAAGTAANASTAKISDLLNKYTKESPYLRQAKMAFGMGKEGTNLTKGSTREAMSESATDSAKKLMGGIEKADSSLGQDVGNSLKKANDSGLLLDLNDELTAQAGRIDDYFSRNPDVPVDSKMKQVLTSITNRDKTDLTPIEAKALKDQANQLIDTLKGIQTEGAVFTRKLAFDFKNSLDNALKENIPEYAEASRKFSDFRTSVPETIVNKDIPSEYSNFSMGKAKAADENLFSASKSMFERSQLRGESNKVETETFVKLARNLRGLEKSNPEAIKKMGFANAEEAINAIRNSSDKEAMLRQVYGVEPRGGLKHSLTTETLGYGMGLANKAGLAAKSIDKMSSSLFKAPSEQLQSLAGRLKADPAGARYGEALENAINSKNDNLKNAALFSILQNPDLRLHLENEPDNNPSGDSYGQQK